MNEEQYDFIGSEQIKVLKEKIKDRALELVAQLGTRQQIQYLTMLSEGATLGQIIAKYGTPPHVVRQRLYGTPHTNFRNRKGGLAARVRQELRTDKIYLSLVAELDALESIR